MSTSYTALVVDDEPEPRQELFRQMVAQGFDVRVVHPADGSLDFAAAQELDAVVTTVSNEESVGYQLVETLLRAPSPPVIAVLMPVIELRFGRRLLKEGVDLLYFKPVDMEQLSELIERRVQERASLVPRDTSEALDMLQSQQ